MRCFRAADIVERVRINGVAGKVNDIMRHRIYRPILGLLKTPV